MTREDAIKVLNMVEAHGFADEAKRMAIEALEQQPCEDAISRHTVLEGLASIAKAKAKSDAQKSLMGRVMFFTEKLPSVSTEKTGRWIEKDDYLYVCSECGQYIYSETEHDLLEFHAFCGRCGTKMEVEE